MLVPRSVSTIGVVVVAVAGMFSSSADAWSSSKMPSNGLNPQVSRKSVLETLVQGGVAAVAAASFVGGAPSPAWAAVESLPSGVTYEVLKKGDGPKPEVGELVAIRFAAYCGDRKIDDIFDTPEPYYTRLGSGGLLKGVESALPEMRLGDRWKLTIPVRRPWTFLLNRFMAASSLNFAPIHFLSSLFVKTGPACFWFQRKVRRRNGCNGSTIGHHKNAMTDLALLFPF